MVPFKWTIVSNFVGTMILLLIRLMLMLRRMIWVKAKMSGLFFNFIFQNRLQMSVPLKWTTASNIEGTNILLPKSCNQVTNKHENGNIVK